MKRKQCAKDNTESGTGEGVGIGEGTVYTSKWRVLVFGYFLPGAAKVCRGGAVAEQE